MADPSPAAAAPAAKPGIFGLLKQTINEWSEDKVPRLSAALAFYTMLSIAPLFIIILKIVRKVFASDPNSQQRLFDYLNQFMGPNAAGAIKAMVSKPDEGGAGVLATVLSTAILFFSASGVFGELQDSMNTIWEVKPRPNRGFLATIKDRFLSMTLVLGTAFLLLVSLVISAVLNAVSGNVLPGAAMWRVVEWLVSFAIVAGLFAVLFKYLPDVKIRWKHVLLGALGTAALFYVGKFALGWYLARPATTSAYGAFGSLVALLLWVYYSAFIFFFGAEFTQVYAHASGDPVVPAENAVAMTEDDRAQTGAPRKAAVKALAEPEPWYPSVPVNRAMAVTNPPSAGGGNGASGGKLVPLLVGLAIGKLFLGGKKKPPYPKAKTTGFAPLRFVEPGWVTRSRRAERERKRLEEPREYVLRVKEPVAVRKAVNTVKSKYHQAKNRIAEFIEEHKS
jgi:membrane protein